MNRKPRLHGHAAASPRSRTPLALALAVALGLAPLAASAATISVTSAADAATSSACTLRDAIGAMNNGADTAGCVHSGDAFGTSDTITFATTAFPTDGTGTITLGGSQLDITDADLSIDATVNSNVTIDANHASRVMRDGTVGSGSLRLANLTLRNGHATANDCDAGLYKGAYGGAICSPHKALYLNHVTVTGNEATVGGGLYSTDARVTLANSSVTGNTAHFNGGGMHAGSVVTVTGSDISNNYASLYHGGGIWSSDHLDLTNSTLSGNSAGASGGAIYSLGDTVTLTNSTLSRNSADFQGGGIDNPLGNVKANNTIVAGNTQPFGDDIVGAALSGNNHNLIGGDPMLGPLADNGGPTQTMLPLSGSPAIDTGACHAAQGDGIPVTDQRGAARPMGSGCDIGAVERYQVNVLRALGRNGQHALAGDVFAQPLVVQALDSAGHAIKGVIPRVVVPSGGPSAMCVAAPADGTGVARIVCAAGAQIGSYTIHVTAPGLGQTVLSVDYTLTNEPNDRIFGSGFEGTALPTAGVSP